MKRILVTYSTMAGSTAEVAQAVAQEIVAKGAQVDVLPLSEVTSLTMYDGVVIGAPMIMGWHRAASSFLKKHRDELQHIPFAVFVTAITLTQTGETDVSGIPLVVDADLAKPPSRRGHLSLRERYACVSNYIGPILRAVRPAKPFSVAVFGGRLEYGRLKWWAVVFAMFIIQAPAKDRRNWTAIRGWASGLPRGFQV